MPKKTVKKTNPKIEKKEATPVTSAIPPKFSFYPLKFKFILIIIVLAVFGLLYFFRSFFVVASVNGQPITRLALIRELEKKGGKQILDSMINQALILQEAKRLNITVTDQELQQEKKKLEDNLTKQGQKLDDLLQAQGMSRSDFEKELRVQKLIEKILLPKVKVTDKDVKDYMEKNKANLTEATKPSDIKSQLEQQKLRLDFQTWLDELRKKAKITYFVNY